jgi:hypothetical protein
MKESDPSALTPLERRHYRATGLSAPVRSGMEKCAQTKRPPCAHCPLIVYCPRPE